MGKDTKPGKRVSMIACYNNSGIIDIRLKTISKLFFN